MMKPYAIVALALVLAQCSAADNQAAKRAGASAQDALLVAAVRARLIGIDADSASAVHVAVNGGVVTLSGQARSASEVSRYTAAAGSISGVKSVRDIITVNAHVRGIGEEANDAALSVRVSAAIASQAGANTFSVKPAVREGVVTLRGSVPTASVARTIVQTTAHLSGVRRVVNDLVIRP